MNKQDYTTSEWLAHLAVVAKALTQEQIEACAYMMGCSGCGWKNITLSEGLEEAAKQAKLLEQS
jgi:Fe-S cluster biogenesis protein NfuA